MTLPLHGIRVLDLTDGLGESAGCYLADLGAEVVKIEPPGGARSRHGDPVARGVSIPFALRNAGKLGVTVDVDDPAGRDRLRELATGADIVVESSPPGWLADRDLGSAHLRRTNPALVWVAISPFGQTGPYREWAASEQVLYALSGALSRSGVPGAEPLLPPAGLVEETVGVHAAWCALLGYYRRLHTGEGEVVDLSAFEAMVHGFDPGFGTQGSAAAGRSEDFPRDRPDAAGFYPVFACRDGFVRVCLLAKRQWRGMFGWLGEPEEFADPKYDTIPARFAAADRLHPLIAKLFSGMSREEIVAEGAARGVPVGGVLDLSEVLAEEQFTASGALVDAEIAPGVRTRIPAGYVRIAGARAGFRTRAPEPGEHDDVVTPRERQPASGAAGPGGLPFEGLRVLDLGVIVFGAELSRQFADNGADVIKIENADFPDGLRQSKRGSALAASVAWGHRNKRSIGIDLRSAAGKELFRTLAADADVVLANFKPGTLESMGLSHAELAALNPRIIVSESSAFGGSGPWRARLGYGPLVRASCGVSALWRYPGDQEKLCDGATVYPDHIAAQVAAVAVLAALIRRRGTGRGAALEVAQSDTALVHLGPLLATEALRTTRENIAAWSGVFRCAGDDEWCVVTVRDDEDWARLCKAIGESEHVEEPGLASAEALVSGWTRAHSPAEVMAVLQAAGVPAGAMLRLPELLTDPQLTDREAFTTIEHDLLPQPLPAVRRIGRFSRLTEPPLRQAPLAGQQTHDICRTALGMADDEIAALVDAGVLQPSTTDTTKD